LDLISRELVVETTTRLAGPRDALPSTKLTLLRASEARWPELLEQASLPLIVDSVSTVADRVQAGGNTLNRIRGALEAAVPLSNRVTPDLSELHYGFRLALFPQVAEVFVDHTVPRALPPSLPYALSDQTSNFADGEDLRFVASEAFSGIIIDARGLLPVHGENNRAEIELALFPGIYDDNLRSVLEREDMDPAFARRWGTAAYSEDFNEAPYVDRIGENPLRIVAVGLFGIYNTDVKIPVRDANRLFADAENARLLREGRVLIIVGDQG
jgi:hypothetical protein